MAKVVDVKNLTKSFTFSVKNPHKGFLSNLFNPESRTVMAVDNISFSVQEGETLAFIGPNGAGKSTTIKILTGILYPTSGKISVLSLNPQLDRKELAFNIGTVFGQRSQLLFNLPLMDTFDLFAKVYELDSKKYKKQKDNLIQLFELEEFIERPVRKLSLGQRMRAEIAASLIHEPPIIFLDEPTIGLDVIAKKKLRENLQNINKEFKTTIFLTSHDVGDIETICERTIVINHGKIIYDKPTANLKKLYLNKKIIKIECSQSVKKQEFNNIAGINVLKHVENELEIAVDTSKISIDSIMKTVFAHVEVKDITIENPPLEETITKIYEEK